MSNCPERVHNIVYGIVDACAEVINTVQFLAQTDCFVRDILRVLRHQCIVTSRRVNLFFLCMFFLILKAVGPIDCHYMTDRLQRFELKIFVCVLLKKQSHLHLRCPGGKQINIKFSFLGELSL